jgi:hypothetical protein
MSGVTVGWDMGAGPAVLHCFSLFRLSGPVVGRGVARAIRAVFRTTSFQRLDFSLAPA